MERMILVFSIAISIAGCASPNRLAIDKLITDTLKKCRVEASRALEARFNTDARVYSREVATEYWGKRGWGNLPVSERKDLMSDTEDSAKDHYKSVRDWTVFECMDKAGFAHHKSSQYWYMGYTGWGKKNEIRSENWRKIKKPIDCLIDRECGSGFACDRQACVPMRNSAIPMEGGCNKDTDCKGNRICEKGQCINPRP